MLLSGRAGYRWRNCRSPAHAFVVSYVSQMGASLSSTDGHPWSTKFVCTHLFEDFVWTCDYQTLKAHIHLCHSPPTSFWTLCSESVSEFVFTVCVTKVIMWHQWSVCTTILNTHAQRHCPAINKKIIKVMQYLMRTFSRLVWWEHSMCKSEHFRGICEIKYDIWPIQPLNSTGNTFVTLEIDIENTC